MLFASLSDPKNRLPGWTADSMPEKVRIYVAEQTASLRVAPKYRAEMAKAAVRFYTLHLDAAMRRIPTPSSASMDVTLTQADATEHVKKLAARLQTPEGKKSMADAAAASRKKIETMRRDMDLARKRALAGERAR